MFFGSTDLSKGVSEAKFDAESDFEVRFAITPQRLDQNRKKQKSNPKSRKKIILAKYPTTFVNIHVSETMIRE